jgi:hypothetical protein
VSALDRLNEIKARLAAAERDAPGPWTQQHWPAEAEGSGWDAEVELRCESGGAVINAMGSESYMRLLGHAPDDIAYLVGELDAIEQALTFDRDRVEPWTRTAELVKAVVGERDICAQSCHEAIAEAAERPVEEPRAGRGLELPE